MREFLAIMAAIVPAAVVAQVAPTPASPSAPEQADEEESASPDIVVTGSRSQPGAVVGDIPPEIQLGPAEIRSYGVGSVAELLAELAPQTTSGRGQGGQPVVLLNGRRISGFREIENLPTEAILRVDILPEEVALKYGYRADQRVVNFVLRRRFRAATIELDDRLATDGGRNAPEAELDLVQIARDTRASLHLEYNAASALTEAERDIAQTNAPPIGQGGAAVDQARFRTLLPATSSFTANGVYARPIGAAQASLNGSIETSDSEGAFGLPIVSLTTPAGTIVRAIDAGEPLRQHNQSLTAHLGSTVNGNLGGAGSAWRWNVTGNYDRVESRTFTDVGVDAAAFQARLLGGDPTANPLGLLLGPADIGPAAANRGFSTSSSAGVTAVVNGTVGALPAGNVSTSLRIGLDTLDFDSRSFHAGLDTAGQVSRDTANAQANVDVPLTSRTRDFLGAIGNLSINGNAAVDRLSDFGTLTTLGYGANWSPIEAVRVIASVTDEENAPSAQQLGNPQVTTPNVRVFDYVRGTTATVTTLTGGNPLLRADDRHTAKIGLTVKPRRATDLTFVADYVSSRTDNPIAGFPAATAAIRDAFPERFARDDAGNLLRIDSRPINFASSERSQIRWGFNLSRPLKSSIQKQIEAFRLGAGPNPFAGLTPPGGARRGGGEGARAQGEGGRSGGGRGGFGGGGGRFGGGGGQGGGRLQFAAYHTWHFTDRVTVADGGPSLDLLNGDATGGNGGQPRHEVEVQAGYANNGIGVRMSGNYRSGTQVQGGTSAASSVGKLNFGSLATANLRVFADLGQRLDLIKAHPWLRGVRVVFAVDNVANTRQRVTDATGTVPVNFQPGYVDPLGRTVRVSLRKLFF